MNNGHLTAVYAGTFDPPTLGHLDIIRRAAAIFGTVTVAVGVNIHKKTMFSADERAAMLQTALADCQNARVASYSGLLVDFCRQNSVHVIIRGVRGGADFDAENTLALVNRSLAPDIETFLMISAPELSFVSSSAVREMAAFGRDISPYVPECVCRMMHEKKGDNP